jgi:hypothetical protein
MSLGQTVPRFLPRSGGDSAANMVTPRPQNLDPTAVNYSDCAQDLNLQFTLLVTGGLPCTDTIQVWVGSTDCTQLSARQTTSGSPRCWPAVEPGLFVMSTSSTNNIRARDLVAFISNTEPPVTYAGVVEARGNACQSQDAPGVDALSVTFMAVEADGQTVDGSVVYTMNAALVGPFPPTQVTAGVGENLIVVNWTPATDATIQGYNIYCEGQGPGDAAVADGQIPPATLVCPDTGVSSASDAEAGTTTTAAVDACVPVIMSGTPGAGGGSCASNNLVDSFCLVNGVSVPVDSCLTTTPTQVDAGEAGIITPIVTDSGTGEASVAAGTAVGISNIPGIYLCGVVGGNTTSSFVVQGFTEGGAGIVDGTEYAVGVAATDGEGNTGLISTLSCVIPQPVITFWDRYLEDGGLAGGGFCALEGAGIPVSGSLFGIGMSAAVLAYARRRRRRSR